MPDSNNEQTEKPSKKKFNSQNFNTAFEKAQEVRKKKENIVLQNKIDKLNKPVDEKMIHNYSIGEIFIGIKDTWFELLDDILQYGLSMDIFTKKNRLYFIGITIILIVSILFVYNLIIGDVSTKQNTELQIRHIHEIINKYVSKTSNSSNRNKELFNIR
jgi:hypothetical protein